MGNPKHKWTPEEEKALRAGIEKYGAGKWKFIQRDPEFNRFLHSRNNIDLKDKWRNICTAEGSRENLRGPARGIRSSQQSDVSPLQSISVPVAPNSLAVVAAPAEPSKQPVSEKKNVPRYDDLIFEALLTTQQPNGLEFNSLASFIEQRIEVPQTFRKQLSSRLRRLVSQEKLEKVANRFKKKEAAENGANRVAGIEPMVIEEILDDDDDEDDDESMEDEAQCVADIEFILEQVEEEDSFEEAAEDATKCVAESEYLSYQAAEAVEEVERIHNMAQQAAQMLQLANEFVELCSLGEVVQLA